MNYWEFSEWDNTWIDADVALIQDRLRRAQLELMQLYTAASDLAIRTNSGPGVFYWLPFSGDGPIQTVTSTTFQREDWWRFNRIRVTNLREAISLLRQSSRLLGHTVSLRLKKLTYPHFCCQLVTKDRIWCLLHGAHPPRTDPGICRPVSAELGRAPCGAGLLTC